MYLKCSLRELLIHKYTKKMPSIIEYGARKVNSKVVEINCGRVQAGLSGAAARTGKEILIRKKN